MICRTDLALEAQEQWPGTLGPEELFRQEEEREGVRLSRIEIRGEKAAEALGRPVGSYITAQVPPLTDNDEGLAAYARVVGEELRRLLPEKGTVLVAGLGNDSITPDALGPQAAALVLATRHIRGEFARSSGLDDLRSAAVLVPGVLGKTGMESGETIQGVCGMLHPAAVIVIDALAARSLERLGCTVQLCDTGIAPGSGVGNNRAGCQPGESRGSCDRPGCAYGGGCAHHRLGAHRPGGSGGGGRATGRTHDGHSPGDRPDDPPGFPSGGHERQRRPAAGLRPAVPAGRCPLIPS